MKNADQHGIYLLLDFHPYLGYAGSQRQLRDKFHGETEKNLRNGLGRTAGAVRAVDR